MKKNLNIALIGAGFMGKAHSFAWSNVAKFYELDYNPVLKVISGVDDDLPAFAAKWGWENYTKDWKEAVNRADVDIVDISAPTAMHSEIAVEAAKAGKHIFCEKPCAIGFENAKKMADAAREAGIVHYLNHNYRRVPAVAYARQLIEEGRLGRIYQYRGVYLQDWVMSPDFPLTWHFSKEKAGGGPLYDLTSHAVDLGRFLVGSELKAVTSVQQTFIEARPLPGKGAATFTAGKGDSNEMGRVEVDDASVMIAEFENGTLGTFESSRFAGGRKNYNTFEIYGSKGSIAFNFERMNELEFLDLTDPADEQGFRTIQVTNMTHPYAGAWWAAGHGIGYENTMVNATADFIKAVQDNKQITPNFYDGEKIIQVLDAAMLSNERRARVLVSEIGGKV